MLRKIAFVHVEIYGQDKLTDALKKRVSTLVRHISPSSLASVANFEHYAMTLRITHDTPASKDIHHLMAIGEVEVAHVVRAIALYAPMCDLYVGSVGPIRRKLSYEVQLLSPGGDRSRAERHHAELCKPIFDYWSGENSSKVRIIDTFDPDHAKILSTTLKKDRWTSMSELLPALEDFRDQGAAKYQLSLLEEAYQRWTEGIDLFHIIRPTQQFCRDISRGIDNPNWQRIVDVIQTMYTWCTNICLTLAADSVSAREKRYHAERALQCCKPADAWVLEAPPNMRTTLRR